jgi:hypothetical protein
MQDLFAHASRLKLRFETKQGLLSTEDLWDLPLTTTRPNAANLDDIAVALDRLIKETGTTSFVKKPTKTNEVNKLKFDIVLYVIQVRQAEAEAEEVKRANAEKKRQILEIIAKKETESLAGQSIEDLRALVATL